MVGGCGSGDTARRGDYSVHGIDVSHYQARIIWDSLPAQDIRFVFIKATEGQDLTDSLFQRNWHAAREAGLYRGAYHFFRPGTPVLQQVLHFIRTVPLAAGDLPPVLDVEIDRGIETEELIAHIRAWLTLIEAHYGVKPMIYSNQKFYNRYLAGRFDDYPLWIARYHHRHPEIAGERRWLFWQYGDRARLTGIQGYVDLNVFAGPLDELEALRIPVGWMPPANPYQGSAQ